MNLWGAVVVVLGANWAMLQFHLNAINQQVTIQQNQINSLNNATERMTEAIRDLAVKSKELELTKRERE